MVQVKRYEKNFIEVYNKKDYIKKLFKPTISGDSFCVLNEGSTINYSKDFIEWKEEIKFELQTIKNNNYIKEALEFLNGDSFNGWHDVSDFNKLEGILNIINKRINEFYKGEEDMQNPFDDLCNDIVDLEKGGNIVEKEIKASVQENMIYINRGDINIEEGDFLIRHLTTGSIERYQVIDRGFYEALQNMMPAHYDCKVEKTTNIIKNKTGVINNYGRININSTDNSINNSTINDTNIFDKMLEACAKSGINDIQIINAIKEMKKCQDKETLKQKIIDFTQLAANCMVILQPFLPCLLKMI